MPESLAAAFARHAHMTAPTSDLEPLLRELVATGQTAWPTVALPALDFARHLGALYDGETPVEDWLGRLRIGELYLTCACAKGLPEALTAFDRHFVARARKYIAHLRPSPAFVDDVLS